MTGIGGEFRFSQSGLQAFDRCRRRFFLRYVDELEWPAPVTDSEEQWEEATRRGQLFHLLVQQSALGIDVEATVAASGDGVLAGWWENFLRSAPCPGAGERILSEVELSAAVGEFSAVAKFDRIVLPAPDSGASIRIIDWKTGRLRPRQAELQRSWQTAVYCYVFTEVGDTLIEEANSGAIDPGRLELQYWHAGFPDALQPIRYSAALHAEAEDRLQRTIAEIASLAEKGEPEGFPRTGDERECRHCEYRSYCGRGRSPGAFAEWEMLPVSDEERDEGEEGPWTEELAGGP